jgi:hypothetical protein
LGKSVVYLVESKFSPTLAEQENVCAAPGDEVILGSEVRFTDLMKPTSRHRRLLVSGDRLKLYDLNSQVLAQQTLIRVLTKLLKAGITVEIVAEKMVFSPQADDPGFRCLALLDGQSRAAHATKVHEPDAVRGRKTALKEAQWPMIKAQLEAPDARVAEVASGLGVGRTTLFRFVTRMREAEGSEEKAGQ